MKSWKAGSKIASEMPLPPGGDEILELEIDLSEIQEFNSLPRGKLAGAMPQWEAYEDAKRKLD